MGRRCCIPHHVDHRSTPNDHDVGVPTDTMLVNGCLNRHHVRHIVFGTFPTINDQWWADKAHQRPMVLTIGGNGIRQVRVVLPDTAIDDTEDLFWIPCVANTANHVSQQGIFASKKMLCKMYRISISNL